MTKVHGTIWGYRRHLRDGEVPCKKCKAVQAARLKAWRRSRGYASRMGDANSVLIQHAAENIYWQYREFHVSCRCGWAGTDIEHAQHVLEALAAEGHRLTTSTQ